ncbi:MAG: BatA domain-containing protein [Bacteroidales bacterium]|jgi:hypothetical protein|nr:BatA domain-containing protein [Bacteroidales bacterium]
MNFTNPLFLYGLWAILVPVVIHLFNFRRYKTTYFSNVKLLQYILQQTKRESRLQHLVVLLFRVLGIALLVLAFARPYIPQNRQIDSSNKLVTIFLDNSYSMEANSPDGSLLQEACDAAKNVVNAFSFSDDFMLVTNDFSANEATVMNRDEMLETLDNIRVSVNSKTFDEMFDFASRTITRVHSPQTLSYVISDFQKSQFNFDRLSLDTAAHIFLLPLAAKQAANIAVDSCWFTTPVFKTGQSVTLTARVHNYGNSEIMKLPVRLFVNDQQRALATADLTANSFSEVRFSYFLDTEGIQRGIVQIDDSPITFDDQLYFTFTVHAASPVVVISHQNTRNRYLQALYGKDSLFRLQEMSDDRVNYATLTQAELVILDQLPVITSGLSNELEKYVLAGGQVLIFSCENQDNTSWNTLLNNLHCATYGSWQTIPQKFGNIDNENHYFNGALEGKNTRVDMPLVTQYREIIPSTGEISTILTLENGTPFLVCCKTGQGQVFLSASAMNDLHGDAHKHALFFVALHNIGLMSNLRQPLYFPVGSNDPIAINRVSNHSEDLFKIKALHDHSEFIPEQRGFGRQTIFYMHEQICVPGFYNMMKGDEQITTLAFNALRKESSLNYYTDAELSRFADANADAHVEIISGNTKNLTGKVSATLNGQALWRYFIVAALGCFLAEILLLRFWGKAKMNKNT